MSKYYTVPSLNEEKVFTDRTAAVEYIYNTDPDIFNDYDTSDHLDVLKDLIEETDYFEDLDKEQQNYLLER